jgi:solute carrier family 10 (sodium/bile acid cotransporter), member 7
MTQYGTTDHVVDHTSHEHVNSHPNHNGSNHHPTHHHSTTNAHGNDGKTLQRVKSDVNGSDAAIELLRSFSSSASAYPPTTSRIPCKCGKEQSFVLCVICTVFLAYSNPHVGPAYLHPDVTAQWVAVVIIFLCAGLNLQTKALQKALYNVQFNAFVQAYNFIVVSVFVYVTTKVLVRLNIVQNKALADGLVVCACLPMAINMVVVLCHASNGDEAAAVFNATLSNLMGVFVSPLLIPLLVGVTGNVDHVAVFLSLTLKVVAPVLVGQVLHYHAPPAVQEALQRHKKVLSLVPQACLLFIIYTVFCQTFVDAQKDIADPTKTSITIHDVLQVVTLEVSILTVLMTVAWYALRRLIPNEPQLRVMGLFGCTHKTVSIGVPLINTIYHGNPSVGLYTLPLLIWNPMQLVIGSLLAPHLAAFVAREHERLGILPDSSNDASATATTLPHSTTSSVPTERDALLIDNRKQRGGPLVEEKAPR